MVKQQQVRVLLTALTLLLCGCQGHSTIKGGEAGLTSEVLEERPDVAYSKMELHMRKAPTMVVPVQRDEVEEEKEASAITPQYRIIVKPKQQ